MPPEIDFASWASKCGELIRYLDGDAFAPALHAAICEAVPYNDCVILVLDREEPPTVLYDNIDPALKEREIGRYVDGPYLLDPFFQAFMNDGLTGLFRLTDLAPDEFQHTEYYLRYYKRTGVVDEAGYLIGLAPDRTMHVSMAKTQRDQSFTEGDIANLRAIEPVIQAAAEAHWKTVLGVEAERSRGETGFRRRLNLSFENFGKSVLTDREAEIVKLMMRGHSAKSAARLLDISPGTVMNHRRNIYAKLEITSQSELFNLFIESLSTHGGEPGDPLAAYLSEVTA